MITKIFIRGLIAVAPLSITLAILLWLFSTLEGWLSKPLQAIISPEYYFRGLGLVAAFLLIFFVGAIVNNFVIQKMTNWFDKLLVKIPLIKTLYRSTGDFFKYFSSSQQKKGKVVVIELQGVKLLGLITREDFIGLSIPNLAKDAIAVYMPMSYQIGGFTVMIPRNMVQPVDMSFEEAMRFALTAGALSENKETIDAGKPCPK